MRHPLAFLLLIRLFPCLHAASGDVTCWGYNGDLQLEVPAALQKVVGLYSGYTHTCAVDSAGGVQCWGGNYSHESLVPADLPPVKSVATGGYRSCAITEDGELICWGRSSQLPDDLGGKVKSIEMGHVHSCVAMEDGSARCFGSGKGVTEMPADLRDVKATASGYTWGSALHNDGSMSFWGYNYYKQDEKPLGFVCDRVSAGSYHIACLNAEGQVFAWGSNRNGQCDVPASLQERNSARMVSAGWLHTCAVAESGRVICWGNNANGECDVPSNLVAAGVSCGKDFTCAWTAEGRAKCWGVNSRGMTEPPALGNAVGVTVGTYHSCALLDDGLVRCWGDPTLAMWGQLDVPSGVRYAAVAAGGWHTCLLTLDTKEVACIGRDIYGVLDMPSGLTGSTALTAAFRHTCALTADAMVVCWGYNIYGELNVPSGLANVVSVKAGAYATCAITQQKEAVCWGRDYHGLTEPPADVGPLRLAVPATAYSCAVSEANDVKCWGAGGNPPVPTDEGKMSTLSMWTTHGCAVKLDGTVTCSGTSVDLGQMTPPPTLSSVVAVDVGSYTSCALEGIVTSTTTQTKTTSSLTATTVTVTMTSLTATSSSSTTSETSTSSRTTTTSLTSTSSSTQTTSSTSVSSSSTSSSTSASSSTSSSSSSTGTSTRSSSSSTSVSSSSSSTSTSSSSLSSSTSSSSTSTSTRSSSSSSTSTSSKTSSSSSTFSTSSSTSSTLSSTTSSSTTSSSSTSMTSTSVTNSSTTSSSTTSSSTSSISTTSSSSTVTNSSTTSSSVTSTSSSSVSSSTSSSVTSTSSSRTTSSSSRTTSSSTQTTTSSSSKTATSTLTRTAVSANSTASSPPAEVALAALEATVSAGIGELAASSGSSIRREVEGGVFVAVKLPEAVGGEVNVAPEGLGVAVSLPSSLLALGNGKPVALALTVLDESAVAKLDATTELMGPALALDLASLAGEALSVKGLERPIVFSLPVNFTEGAACAYFDEEKRKWSTEGVRLGAVTEGGPMVCESSHLTLFATILKGFVLAFQCSHYMLLSAEGFKALAEGDWHRQRGAVLFWCVVAVLAMTFGIAAILDRQRQKWFSWTPDFFLVPLHDSPQPEPEEAGKSRCFGCMGHGCRENTFKNIMDEVASEWFDYFSDLRSLCETVLEGMEVSLDCRVAAGAGRRMTTRLLSMSSKRLAGASTGLSQEVVTFLLEDKDFTEYISLRRHARARAEDRDGPREGLAVGAEESLPASRARTEETEVSFQATRHETEVSFQTTRQQSGRLGNFLGWDSGMSWKAALNRDEAWLALHDELSEHLPKHVTRHSWCALPRMILELFWINNPISSTFQINIFSSCKLRALLLIVEISSALLVTSLFFADGSSGGKRRRIRQSNCDDRELQAQAAFKVGRVLALATSAVVLSWIPTTILESLHTVGFRKVAFVGCKAWEKELRTWQYQDRLIFLLGGGYIAFCLLFTAVFLANVDNAAHANFGFSCFISLLQDAVVFPLTLSMSIPTAARMLLSATSRFSEHRRVQLVQDVYRHLYETTNVLPPVVGV